MFAVLADGAIHGFNTGLLAVLMFVVGGLGLYALVRVVTTQALPKVRVADGGQQTVGKVIRTEMAPGGRTARPIVRFRGPADLPIEFRESAPTKTIEQPGDAVTVRYDSANPQVSATILDSRAARRYLRQMITYSAISAVMTTLGLLAIIGVISPASL
jgi:hypothetical protein